MIDIHNIIIIIFNLNYNLFLIQDQPDLKQQLCSSFFSFLPFFCWQWSHASVFIILLCLQVMVLTFCFYQKLIFCRKLFLCCCVYRWMVYLILMIINRLTGKVIIANNFSAAMFTVAWVISSSPRWKPSQLKYSRYSSVRTKILENTCGEIWKYVENQRKGN